MNFKNKEKGGEKKIQSDLEKRCQDTIQSENKKVKPGAMIEVNYNTLAVSKKQTKVEGEARESVLI